MSAAIPGDRTPEKCSFQSKQPIHSTRSNAAPLVVGVFAGEGIGPEVVGVALNVLKVLAEGASQRLDIRFGGPIGRIAMEETGETLTDQAAEFCESIFAEGGALFCGPAGARFVYELRTRFDLFCKFTPLAPMAEIRDAILVRHEKLSEIDIVAVRENVGGLYFAEEQITCDAVKGRRVEAVIAYEERQVRRILVVAGRLASQRRGEVCVVVKRDGIPAMSDLWIDEMKKLEGDTGVRWTVLDIDNAVYQLVSDPGRFDVLVSPNMFGDVLADCGALLLGSRGLSFSGNFSGDGRSVFQTGHGAAYDLAGTGAANPVGQVLSLAMMLEQTYGWPEGAGFVRSAVKQTLSQGVRTADIKGSATKVVGCHQMGQHICENLTILMKDPL